MAAADAAVLEALVSQALQPAVLEAAIAEAVREVSSARLEVEQRIAVLDQECGRLDGELANLAAIAAAGGDVPSVVARLRESQARRDELRARADRLRAELEIPTVATAKVRAVIRRQVADLHRRLLGDRAGAREVLEAVLADRLLFTPESSDTGCQRYRVTGALALDKVLTAEVPIGVASLSIPSWNHLLVWLREMDDLRRFAKDAA